MAIAAQIRANRHKSMKLADRAATNSRSRRVIGKDGPAGGIVTPAPAQDSHESEAACELGQRLLRPEGLDDEPCVLVAELEESAEGCRWLRDRWVEIGQRLAAGRPWLPADQLKFVRLLGKHPIEAINDPELNAIFQAWGTGWPRTRAGRSGNRATNKPSGRVPCPRVGWPGARSPPGRREIEPGPSPS